MTLRNIHRKRVIFSNLCSGFLKYHLQKMFFFSSHFFPNSAQAFDLRYVFLHLLKGTEMKKLLFYFVIGCTFIPFYKTDFFKEVIFREKIYLENTESYTNF